MSKTVRLDDEVIAHIQKYAFGFETPNKVLRRLLGIDKPEDSNPSNEQERQR